MKVLMSLLLLAFLCTSARAQQKKPLFDNDDKALIAAMALDEASTAIALRNCACREAGLIKSTAPRIAFKAGSFALIKILEPRVKDKSFWKWTKRVNVAFFIGLSINNFAQAR